MRLSIIWNCNCRSYPNLIKVSSSCSMKNNGDRGGRYLPRPITPSQTLSYIYMEKAGLIHNSPGSYSWNKWNVRHFCFHNQNNSTSFPGFLGWRCFNLQLCCTFDVIGWLIVKFLQIWSSVGGYGELCVCFRPIRNGEIFWMNNNID